MFNWQQAAARLGAAQAERDRDGDTLTPNNSRRLDRLADDALALWPRSERFSAVGIFTDAYRDRAEQYTDDEAMLDPFEDDLAVSA